MKLKGLSSNWKQLQKSLQKNQTSKPIKRKASENILQPQRNGAKRHKSDPKLKKLSAKKLSRYQTQNTLGTQLMLEHPHP